MNKKAFTLLFTIVSTIVNIIMTLLIVIALVVVFSVILSRVFNCENATVYSAAWLISFLGGMVLGMFLFVRLTGWVIRKFNLESKLDPRLAGRYVPGTTRKFQEDAQKEPPKRKTNLPDSVKIKEDTWGQDNPYEEQQVFPLRRFEEDSDEANAANGDKMPTFVDPSAIPFSAADKIERETAEEDSGPATEEEMDNANALAAQNLFPLRND